MMQTMLRPATGKAKRQGSIRSRLVAAFILIALVPTGLISLVLFMTSAESNRVQVGAQLQSAAKFKAGSVENWAAYLMADLSGLANLESAGGMMEMVLKGSDDPDQYQAAVNQVTRRFDAILRTSNNYTELHLLNQNGTIILSTQPERRGRNVGSESYFRQARFGSYVAPFTYSPVDGVPEIIVTTPIRDSAGGMMGVLAARANPAGLYPLLQDPTGLGRTGEAYLIDRQYNPLTPLREGYRDKVGTPGTQALVQTRKSGFSTYENYLGVPVIGAYEWITSLGVGVMAEQPQSESQRASFAVLAVNASVALTSVIVGVLASLAVTYQIATPISELALTARDISSGVLRTAEGEERNDELGDLAQAFNSMTLQQHRLINELEDRVAERTLELEKRSKLLESSSLVNQAAVSILDLNELIVQVVEVIRQNFNLYYTGLFLADQNQEWAVLRAGTGEAGKAMLARGHRLKIGGGSMIGWCVARGQPRVALEAGEDAVRLATPELPLTRSEAAIPLRARGAVLGALTVQSAEPNAFDSVTLSVLQSMADQVAVAIENARLYTESQATLEAERRAYTTASQAAWRQILRRRSGLSFRSDPLGVGPASPQARPDLEQAYRLGETSAGQVLVKTALGGNGSGPGVEHHTLAIPIKVRGLVIGVLDTHKPVQRGPWTKEEQALLENIAEQLGAALDSARLYEETQDRAERERMVAEVTARMRESLDLDAVLQTAVREVGQALGLEEVSVLLANVTGEKAGEANGPAEEPR